MQQDTKQYEAIKSPWVWGNLSALQLQIGINNPDILQQGRDSLSKFELLSDPGDNEMLRAQFLQHWTLALSEHDVVKAKEYLTKVASLPKTVKIDSWEKTKNWRFTKEVFAKKIASEQQLKDMFMPLKDHFKAD